MQVGLDVLHERTASHPLRFLRNLVRVPFERLFAFAPAILRASEDETSIVEVLAYLFFALRKARRPRGTRFFDCQGILHCPPLAQFGRLPHLRGMTGDDLARSVKLRVAMQMMNPFAPLGRPDLGLPFGLGRWDEDTAELFRDKVHSGLGHSIANFPPLAQLREFPRERRVEPQRRIGC